MWKPLGMSDTHFVIPADKTRRYAKALPVDPDTGRPQTLRALTEPTKFECGGGCVASTASDYLRFALDAGEQGQLRRPARARPQDGRVHDRRTISRPT